MTTMAYTKIKAVKNHLKRCLDYAANPANSLIPFENEYPKNKTYQLLTTKPGEMEQ